MITDNWELIIGISLFFFLIIFFSWERKRIKKAIRKGFVRCPLRNILVKKYDIKGNYSEEYQRICLIKYFLRKGYQREQVILEYSIRLGHKGHNTLRVDLAIKKNNKFLVVAEVKKNYNRENRNSAIKHQLVPAMRILNSKYGIYFDGTTKNCLLVKNINGSLSARPFP